MVGEGKISRRKGGRKEVLLKLKTWTPYYIQTQTIRQAELYLWFATPSFMILFHADTVESIHTSLALKLGFTVIFI